jgi:hypothetical protein
MVFAYDLPLRFDENWKHEKLRFAGSQYYSKISSEVVEKIHIVLSAVVVTLKGNVGVIGDIVCVFTVAIWSKSVDVMIFCCT